MNKTTLGVSIETLFDQMVRQTRQSDGYGSRRKGESVKAWQRRLGRKLRDLLAIKGKARKAPPVRFVERDQCDGYIRRRGYMVAQDGLAVPFYLLEPDPAPSGAMPVCVAAQGHGPGKVIPVGLPVDDRARQLIETGQRDYGVQAVRNGYLTIAPDFRGFGELMLADEAQAGKGNSCQQLSLRSIQMGKPLLGQKVSDVMQFIDWALARRDTDPKRVVMTGNSHGGTMTLFCSAIDKRISACAVSCYFSSFAASILATLHCACNYVPGLLPVAEMSDLAGLVAPRPMLVITGTKDPIFPIDAVRKGFLDLGRIYADAKAAKNLELFEGDGAHRYYAARVWDFFAEKLG